MLFTEQALAGGLLPVGGMGAEEVTVSLIHTSGLQGNLEHTPKIQPLFKQIQQEEGKALLLNAGSALSPGESAYKG
jgi:2',3'-cyclic-nucleotide 2'-phosphodiesterase (5'-nucleotidase family)